MTQQDRLMVVIQALRSIGIRTELGNVAEQAADMLEDTLRENERLKEQWARHLVTGPGEMVCVDANCPDHPNKHPEPREVISIEKVCRNVADYPIYFGDEGRVFKLELIDGEPAVTDISDQIAANNPSQNTEEK